MKRIALKIDVDTFHGTVSGVPLIVEALKKHAASASFFFSFGPDHSGRDARADSLCRHYDLSTRLYGRLLPGPNIGVRGAEAMRLAEMAGCEVGIHAWDRAVWERNIRDAENPWVESEMGKACSRFAEVFSATATAHAAAGWRMNRHALRLTQRLGFKYASDCRGSHPFIPVIDGEIVNCPQLPTTLPTLDEVLALEPGFSPIQAADRILQLADSIDGDHVFTLRAELEGLRFGNALECLLSGWHSRGYALVALRELHASLDVKALPRHAVRFAEVPGRAGWRLVQDERFPQ